MEEKQVKPKRRTSLRKRLEQARKENRVMTSEEIAQLKEDAKEQFEDHQGTIDAIRTSHTKVLQIEAHVFGKLQRAPVVIEALKNHKTFIDDFLRDLLAEGFPQAEVTRVEGVGKFRALIDFANNLNEQHELDFAVQEAVRCENLRGPVSREEMRGLERAKKPKLFTSRGVYTPLFPEKPAVMALMKALWNAARRVKEKEKEREGERIRKSTASGRKLTLCFRNRDAEGNVAFMFPWQNRGREFFLYLEVEFGKDAVTIVDATGEFAPKIGETYPRNEIPSFLKAAIHRGIESMGRKGKENVIPLRMAQ